MQIGASVSDRSYVPYRSNARTNQFGEMFGVTKEEMAQQQMSGVSGALTRAENEEQTEEDTDYLELLRQRKDEILEKVQKGETEPAIQTGAQAFTEKEWDRLLERFDSAEDELKKLMREEYAKRWKENINKTEIMNDVSSEAESMLVCESTACTVPSTDSGKEDVRYITWYTQEGIFCRKAGQKEGYEWSIAFENREQYDKVIEYLKQHEKDEDLTFTADENFWREFLK